MENNIVFLSFAGFDNYYITKSGQLYKTAPDSLPKEIKTDKLNRYHLTNANGQYLRISKRTLYKIAFNKCLCIDTIKNLSGEEWKPIEKTNGKYFISNCGRVKSYCGKKARILKPFITKQGYLMVKINGKNKQIHQLVAFAFCKNNYTNCNIKTEVHHINQIKDDNRAENLIILSVSEHKKEHYKKECFDNG